MTGAFSILLLTLLTLFPLFLRRLHKGCEYGPGETANGGDHEGGDPNGGIGVPLGGILEVGRDLWPYHTGQTIGNKDVAVVEPHVLVSEIVRRGGGEQSEISAEVESNDTGSGDEGHL